MLYRIIFNSASASQMIRV